MVVELIQMAGNGRRNCSNGWEIIVKFIQTSGKQLLKIIQTGGKQLLKIFKLAGNGCRNYSPRCLPSRERCTAFIHFSVICMPAPACNSIFVMNLQKQKIFFFRQIDYTFKKYILKLRQIHKSSLQLNMSAPTS